MASGRPDQPDTTSIDVDYAHEETALLRAAAADPELFRAVYERYFDRIYAYCRRRTASEADAEDLTSQIFAQALNGIAGYRGGSAAAWLFRIAHNVIVNHYRDRRPQHPLCAAESQLDDRGTPLEQIVRKEERQTLLRLISALPPEAQDLLWMRIASGLKASEIAIVVGKSPGAVRMALHRLYKQLRDQFNQEFR